MSLLQTYRKYAPFVIDDLIDAANALLLAGGAPTIQKRTVRYYTAQKVMPRPLGSPKFARYGYEHLLCLVAIRVLQDQGLVLGEIAEEVAEAHRGQYSRMEKFVESWLGKNAGNAGIREAATSYRVQEEDEEERLGRKARHFQLTPATSLIISGGTSIRKELEQSRDGILEILRNLG
jgi:DNA-binding transcriptional MerR regulator